MSKIPKFKTDEEAAKFWDNHSLANYEKKLKSAGDIAFVKPDRQVVSLRLDRKMVKILKSLAARKGMGYTSLLRMWVFENIQRAIHGPGTPMPFR